MAADRITQRGELQAARGLRVGDQIIMTHLRIKIYISMKKMNDALKHLTVKQSKLSYIRSSAKSFRPDIQKPRQTENAVRDI